VTSAELVDDQTLPKRYLAVPLRKASWILQPAPCPFSSSGQPCMPLARFGCMRWTGLRDGGLCSADPGCHGANSTWSVVFVDGKMQGNRVPNGNSMAWEPTLALLGCRMRGDNRRQRCIASHCDRALITHTTLLALGPVQKAKRADSHGVCFPSAIGGWLSPTPPGGCASALLHFCRCTH
jgi:hypothetical protein